MTKPQDRLIALGALTEGFGMNTDATYLAGIWDGIYLLPGLLWRRVVYRAGEQLYARSGIYRAPSWSWAATDGAIERSELIVEEDREFDDRVEVSRLSHSKSMRSIFHPEKIQGSVVLLNEKLPYNEVTDGRISACFMVRTVEGVLNRSSTRESFERILGLSVFESGQNSSDSFLSCWPDAKDDLKEGFAKLTLLGLTGAAEEIVPDKLNRPNFVAGGKERWYTVKDIQFKVFGLLVTTVATGVYSRIGYFELSDKDYSNCMAKWNRTSIVLI